MSAALPGAWRFGTRAQWWARLRRPLMWTALLVVPAAAQAGPQAPRTAQAPAAGTTQTGETWNGGPRTLRVNESAALAQTPAGSTVLTWINTATQNNLGELAMTSGGRAPVFLKAPALATQPEFRVSNWRANNLRLTNVSANDSTPIRIQLVGPGMPGTRPAPLVDGAAALQLASGGTAQGATAPRSMQLVMRSSSGSRSVVVLIGGPADSTGRNSYVIAVNDSATTGPGASRPPRGYYATTTNNAYTFSFRWNGASIFVANLSASTAPPVSLVLRGL